MLYNIYHTIVYTTYLGNLTSSDCGIVTVAVITIRFWSKWSLRLFTHISWSYLPVITYVYVWV